MFGALVIAILAAFALGFAWDALGQPTRWRHIRRLFKRRS